ncbi:MAG: S-layer homology domain-containing protein [Armatimonadetes bacterium]|nr:S-layer homology domain-containing protein [Armatimonadota bacterium]
MEIKKSLALLAGAGALLAFTPAASQAQDQPAGAASGPFADVPADHWAYNAVKTLQDAKIVIGYPDGTYGGRRPMTRYEFATAIARLMPLLSPDTSNFATKGDLDALRNDLTNRLQQNQAALDALTRLVNEFQPELQRLGQDVAAVQARLANLEGRVAAVEAEQQRLRITGEVNIIGEAANSTHKNGTPGAGSGAPGAPGPYSPFFDKNGITQGATASNRLVEASDVYEDVLLHLRGKLSDTATANVDLDFGDFIPNLFDTARAGEAFSIGGLGNGSSVSDSFLGGNFSNYLYQAYLDAPVSLGPLGGASVKVGRFGTQFTKWTLKQEDADIYTRLYQTDSGNILTDGGWLGFKLGPVGVQGYAGKFDTTPFSQAYVGTTVAGVGPSQIGAHPLGTFTTAGATRGEGGVSALDINHGAPITQAAGARFTLGSPENLVLGATVEQFAVGSTIVGSGLGATGTGGFLDPNEPGKPFNRVSVYGADLNGGLPFLKKNALTFQGAYTVSAEGANSGFNNVGNKARYQSHEELLGFNVGKLGVQAGYQFVGPYFSAPGYWGKVGAWTNPTNVKGGVYLLKYPITTKLALNADYEQYKAAYGTNENGSLVSSPINGRDHVNRYQVGLGYGLTSNNAVDLGYEKVQWDLRNGNGSLATSGKPTEDYVTLGIGHSFNQNTSFKLLYQIVHYNDHGTGFGSTTGLTGGDNNYSGNVAVGQFSLKF